MSARRRNLRLMRSMYPGIALPLACSLVACGVGDTASDAGRSVLPQGDLAPVPTVATGRPAARAHLLLQPGDYDGADPQRMDGAYRDATRWEVPDDLAPQNKYVMFEGPALENDVIAFRFYADARHRSDVYGKRVPDIVLDTIGWDYHAVRDWGADVLKVGESLGIGAPAVVHDGRVETFASAAAKTVEVVAAGGDTAMVRFAWRDLELAGARVDLEQDWWTVPGVYWAQVDVRVTDGELPEGARFATGIVRHDTAGAPARGTTAGGCAYVATWGPQADQGDDLGLGVVALAAAEPLELPDGGPAAAQSYLLAFAGGEAAARASYRMVSAWGRGHAGLRDAAGFAEVVAGACGSDPR